MAALPVNLNVAGRRCVIVGGGTVAARRAASLLDAGARVRVIARTLDDRFAGLAIDHEARGYERGDLIGAFLVVIATDDAPVNEQAAMEAAVVGVLVNRADAPAPGSAPGSAPGNESGDLTIPAVHRAGPVTITVDTAGISAAAAAMIRDQLADALDPAWPRLLTLAAPHRAAIQDALPPGEARLARLRRLTDAEAMNILQTQGEAAYQQHCRTLADPTHDAP